MIGIYCIKNKINGKRYIGQSINIGKRLYEHQVKATRYFNDISYNSVIHQAIRKYGWGNFEIEILLECSVEELDKNEILFIEQFDTLSPNGYNIQLGGQSFRVTNSRRFCRCGKLKEKNALQCLECYNNERKQRPFPKGIDLVVLCLDTSMEAVARQYGYVSGNSVKAELKSQGLPYMKADLYHYYEKHFGYPHPSIKKERDAALKRTAHKTKFAPQAVNQYDLQGNFIQTFSTMNEAFRKTGAKSGHISEAVRGKRKTAGGFTWKLVNDVGSTPTTHSISTHQLKDRESSYRPVRGV